LEWDYKFQPVSDHVAKFQGDRSRDLGKRVAKKRKITSRVKHSPPETVVPGSLINNNHHNKRALLSQGNRAMPLYISIDTDVQALCIVDNFSGSWHGRAYTI